MALLLLSVPTALVWMIAVAVVVGLFTLAVVFHRTGALPLPLPPPALHP